MAPAESISQSQRAMKNLSAPRRFVKTQLQQHLFRNLFRLFFGATVVYWVTHFEQNGVPQMSSKMRAMKDGARTFHSSQVDAARWHGDEQLAEIALLSFPCVLHGP